MKFRKKPVVIEAEQWDGNTETANKLLRWANGQIMWHFNQNILSIKTLEGLMTVSLNDWVIQGINGEFYPCKPDIFDKTYEKVE